MPTAFHALHPTGRGPVTRTAPTPQYSSPSAGPSPRPRPGADGGRAEQATVPAPARPEQGASAASAVLVAVRRARIAFRDELAGVTGLSLATVNRQVVALVRAGVLRERPDLAPVGAVGRPRVPVEVDPERYGVLGLHIGTRRTTLTAGDLRGSVLGAVDVPTPRDGPGEVVELLVRRLRRFGEQLIRHEGRGRRLLRVGLVVGGELAADRRRLRHPALGWESTDLDRIADPAALPDVVVALQVEAMAGAETFFAAQPGPGPTLHVYARESVGAILTGAGSGVLHSPGTIAHLPVGGTTACQCGRTGCLEATVGDAAVVAAAAGIVPEPGAGSEGIAAVIAAAEGGNRLAHDLLVERARLLGRGVALVRDLLNPARVVLSGQAFTGYRPGLTHLSASFAESTALEPLSLQVSSLGPAVQAVAACTTALGPVYADPVGAARRGPLRRAVPRPEQ